MWGRAGERLRMWNGTGNVRAKNILERKNDGWVRFVDSRGIPAFEDESSGWDGSTIFWLKMSFGMQ